MLGVWALRALVLPALVLVCGLALPASVLVCVLALPALVVDA